MALSVTGSVPMEPRQHEDFPPPPRGDRRTRTWLAFVLLMPLLMGLPLGWYGAGIGSQMTRAGSLTLWISVCWLSWWMSELCARALARLLRPWDPAPWLLLFAGYGINMALSSYYNPAVLDALLRIGLVSPTPALIDYFRLDRNLLDAGYLSLLVVSGLPGLLFWIAGNYVFERMTGVPRLRRPLPLPDRAIEPSAGDTAAGDATAVVTTAAASATPATPAASPAPTPPRFFQRMTRFAGLRLEELVAVEAEDHYIQVHTTRGKELVYYRFRDALEELEAVSGLQIHRSAWVSRQGIAALDGGGRNLQVLLVTGDRLKVSLSNRGALLQAGLPTR